jgi:glycosyltransferase involved in cell wall biosynthesis
MEALVSIIVPAYNAVYSIERCLKSVLNQTYANLEVIVVDDGSLDDTLSVVKKIQKTDKRLITFSKKNGGVSSARNYGLSMATGKFVMFCDSDDWIEPDMIENMVEANDKSPFCLTVCGINYVNKKKTSVMPLVEYDFVEISQAVADLYCNGLLNLPSNKLYIKKYMRKFNEKVKCGEDLIFNLQYIRNCPNISIVTINKAFYNYTFDDSRESLSNRYFENQIEWKEMIIQEFLQMGLSDEQLNKVMNIFILDYISAMKQEVRHNGKNVFLSARHIREWNERSVIQRGFLERCDRKCAVRRLIKWRMNLILTLYIYLKYR